MTQMYSDSGILVGLTPEVKPTRCFITKVEVERPDFNRFVSRVHFQADHALSNGFEGSISVADGNNYNVGDVITVTITKGDQLP